MAIIKSLSLLFEGRVTLKNCTLDINVLFCVFVQLGACPGLADDSRGGVGIVGNSRHYDDCAVLSWRGV